MGKSYADPNHFYYFHALGREKELRREETRKREKEYREGGKISSLLSNRGRKGSGLRENRPRLRFRKKKGKRLFHTRKGEKGKGKENASLMVAGREKRWPRTPLSYLETRLRKISDLLGGFSGQRRGEESPSEEGKKREGGMPGVKLKDGRGNLSAHSRR